MLYYTKSHKLGSYIIPWPSSYLLRFQVDPAARQSQLDRDLRSRRRRRFRNSGRSLADLFPTRFRPKVRLRRRRRRRRRGGSRRREMGGLRSPIEVQNMVIDTFYKCLLKLV